MKDVRILFSILFIGLLSFASCANPKELVYQDVKNFRIKEISLRPNVGMDVQFYNPNKYGMTMKDADVNLFLNGKLVGNAKLANTYNVPANDTFLLPVNLVADLESVLANALEILANKQMDVELKGTVKAGRGVFINIPINYKGKQELNVTGF
jgi:LEA14-like dessication related protein